MGGRVTRPIGGTQRLSFRALQGSNRVAVWDRLAARDRRIGSTADLCLETSRVCGAAIDRRHRLYGHVLREDSAAVPGVSAVESHSAGDGGSGLGILRRAPHEEPT